MLPGPGGGTRPLQVVLITSPGSLRILQGGKVLIEGEGSPGFELRTMRVSGPVAWPRALHLFHLYIYVVYTVGSIYKTC